MIKTIYPSFLFLILFITAQAKNHSGTAIITGTIIDATSHKPVGYATIALTDQASNKILANALTDSTGKFALRQLPAGLYQLKISFVGYTDKLIPA